MNSPWFREMLYDVEKSEASGWPIWRTLSYTHTHILLHTHGRGRWGGGREKNLEKKNVYVCKSSLEGGRGGLYEWWSWLGKELSSADLFRFKFPPNTYLYTDAALRESSWWPFNHYRLFPLLSLSLYLLHFPSYLSIYVLTSFSIYIYYTYVYKYITHV